LPKYNNITQTEINKLAYDLTEFPYDYLIPNDISTSKLYLLDLLKKQFNSKLKFYLYDKIKYEGNSYYKSYDNINYFYDNKYLNIKDYIFLSHKLDKKILNYMLPNSNIILPKYSFDIFYKIERPIFINGNTEILINPNNSAKFYIFKNITDYKLIILDIINNQSNIIKDNSIK
jgi:hypothetical protein